PRSGRVLRHNQCALRAEWVTGAIMPNGRSGGFLIPRNELEDLLNGLSDHPVLGRALTKPADARSWSDLDAAAVVTILGTFAGARVWVEEQDHSYYVLNLDREAHESGEPEAWKWIVVSSESPLFEQLRECHQRQWK